MLLATVVARADHLYGSGIVDRQTKAILTLRCIDADQDPAEGEACTQAQWRIEFSDRGSNALGKPYSISRQAYDDHDAFMQLDGFQMPAEFYDLEKDAIAKGAFQKYINGFAKHARRDFREGGLFSSRTKVFFGTTDITASYYADREAGYSALQHVSKKQGWNWSEKPKKVSHDYFTNMLQLVVKRALESKQLKFVDGDQSLRSYLKAIEYEQKAKQMVRRMGREPGTLLDHFSNGDEMVRVLNRAEVSFK
jgi:hypothetical protein